MVKMQLKEEVGGRTLNDEGNYVVDHEKNQGIVFLSHLLIDGIVTENGCGYFGGRFLVP